MLDTLHSGSFAGCLHDSFHVMAADSDGFDLVLTQVTEQVRTARQESFSTVFHGPAAPFMQQGVYRLYSDKLGELELFLVPIGRDDEGYLYEAVFNRLLPAA